MTMEITESIDNDSRHSLGEYSARCIAYEVSPLFDSEGICSLRGNAVSRDAGCNNPENCVTYNLIVEKLKIN